MYVTVTDRTIKQRELGGDSRVLEEGELVQPPSLLEEAAPSAIESSM